MIELIPTWFILVVCAATMLVNRAGASRVFFDVIGVFYGNRMLKDARAQFATLNSLALDGLSGIEDAASMFGAKMAALTDDVIPIANRIADARIEFEKFVESAEDADKIAREVVEIGQGFGFTADQALMAAARMAQLSSVVGPDVIPAATQVGMEFGLIGGMGTEEAMTKLINLQQQTGFMLGEMTLEQFRAMDAEEQANIVRENSIATLDQLNTIENRSAATMQHMTFVMNQFASQADLANESIAGMAAQSATLIEAGEEQGKAGRALKQIYARLGADTSGAATEIEALGVATRDSNGDMRALTQIVNELAPAYQDLNGEQKTNLAIAVAGTHHYARFLKLMENNERTQELMIQSTLGLSPAMDEVNIRLENQVTVLREAEAELDKYKGTLGDALTPSVIMATQVQAEYNKQLTALFAGSGGDLLNNLFGVSKVVQDTASGFFQNFVNIVQMNVALATQKVLTASLRGEEMIREDFMSTKLRERTNFNSLITDEMREQNEKAAAAKSFAASLLDNSRMTMLLEQDVTQEKLNQLHLDFIEQRQLIQKRQQMIGIAEAEALRVRAQRDSLRVQQHILSGLVTEQRVTANLAGKAADEASSRRDESEQNKRFRGEAHRIRMQQHDEEVERLSVKHEQEQEILNTLKQQEASYDQQIMDLDKIIGSTEERIQNEQLGIGIAQQRQEDIAQEIGAAEVNIAAQKRAAAAAKERESSKKIEERGLAYGKEAVAGQQLAMSMMAAGSAMMMFSGATDNAEERSKRMRVAMVLMNTAMIPQILSMAKLSKEMGIGINLDTIKATVMKHLAVENARVTSSNFTLAGSYTAVGAAARAAGMAAVSASKSIAKSLAPMAIMIGVGFALTELMERLGIFGDAELFTESGSASIQDTAEAFDDNTKSITQLANEIVEYENELDRIVDLEGQQYEDRKAQLLDLIALNQRLIGVIGSQVAEELGFQEAADSLFGLKGELSDIEQQFGDFDSETGNFKTFSDAGVLENIGQIMNRGDRFMKDELIASRIEAQRLSNEISILLASNADFAEFIETNGITTLEQFIEALSQNDRELQNLQDTLNGSEGSMDGFNSEIENSIQLFDEFNNAREELFFGFKAGNITGDLVKQIEQKGVENFVANTEIIMTNNFNGMTTDQVADEILRKINERAVTNGINVSPV